MSVKPLHPDHPEIPVDRAWQEGRRLYVRCGYTSQLNKDMRALKATWDPDKRALYTGTGKREQVTAAVLASLERAAAIEAVKALGLWVIIPFEAEDIRARAKNGLHGVFDGERKAWAMRTEADLAEIQGLIRDRQAAIDAARAAEQQRARQQADQDRAADLEAAAIAARRRSEEIVARSDRTPTGETATVTEVSTRFMNKRTAASMARSAGTVLRLSDGRRGLIVAVDIWFTDEEMASSVCWHDATMDEAHWDFRYSLVIVEPTAEETTADEAEAAYRRDAAAIYHLFEETPKLTGARADDQWTLIPANEQAGSIHASAGSTAYAAGTVILTTGGRVVWQHPGWYDDYVRSEGTSTDPELADRVRAILAGGPRRRVYRDRQVPVDYDVRIPAEPGEEGFPGWPHDAPRTYLDEDGEHGWDDVVPGEDGEPMTYRELAYDLAAAQGIGLGDFMDRQRLRRGEI
jgi:hypothetical protein